MPHPPRHGAPPQAPGPVFLANQSPTNSNKSNIKKKKQNFAKSIKVQFGRGPDFSPPVYKIVLEWVVQSLENIKTPFA